MNSPGATATEPAAHAPLSSKPLTAKQLDRSLVHGVLWTGAVKWGGQGLSWAATLIVARLLTREDYGLVGMATVFFGLVTMLTEFGIGATIVTLRDLTDQQIRQLNGFAVLFGVAGCVVSLAAAIPLSRFFDAPELAAVVVVLSVTFISGSFRSIPTALLQRDLKFQKVAILDGIHTVVMSVTWITLALLGLRYWTLVFGAIAGSVISAALAYSARPTGFALPRMASISAAITLSRHVVITRLCWYGYSNADFIVAGRLLGKAALGSYGFAWTIASIPVEKISAMVSRVTPSILSAAQSNTSELRRYLVRVTGGLAILTFPAAVGLALVADDFVRQVLGPEWEDAIVPLRILSAYASIRSIAPMLAQTLTVIGEARFVMWNTILAFLTLPVAFVIGARWGAGGIAAAWVIIYPFVLVPMFRRTFKRLSMTVGDYMTAIWPAAISCAVMAAGVLGVRLLLGVLESGGWVRLIAQVGLGVVLYAGSLQLIFPEDAARLRRVVAGHRNRGD